MEVKNLGTFLTADSHDRDAGHIATVPVLIVEEGLKRGQHIGKDKTKQGVMYCANSLQPPIGIIDPFLPRNPVPGDRVLLWLYPYTVTSLRHEWTHPAFENTTSIEASNAIKDYVASKTKMGAK